MSTRTSVLLFGCNGQVASELRKAAPEEFELVTGQRPEVDLADPESVRVLIERVQPSVIINAAAYTAVDRAESERELAFRVNAVAPGVMAEEAKKLDIPIVHYSTDYVYAGDKGAPYVESDAVGPLNVYGHSKLAGDRAIEDAGAMHLILRTSWVFGGHGANFMRTMLRVGAEREEVSVVADQRGTPTESAQIAAATWPCVRKLLAEGARALSGTYHLTAAGETTWHGFAEEIFRRAKALGLVTKIKRTVPITTEEYPTAARRPTYSVLSSEKLQKRFGIRLPDWKAGLQHALDETALNADRVDAALHLNK